MKGGVLILLLALLVPVLVMGCGGDDDDNDSAEEVGEAIAGQTAEADDADAKAAVRTAQTAAETIATDNNGAYDGATGVTVPNLEGVEATLTDADLSVPAVEAAGYTVRVTSESGNAFDITRTESGTVELTCTEPGEGGCPETGTWD